MTRSCDFPSIALIVCAIGVVASEGSAQTVGTLRWQLQPYCNVVALVVSQHAGVYTLDGVDDQCGAGRSASAVGLAFFNPDGTIGFGLTTVPSTGGAVHVTAALSLASLGGTWRDSLGNTGALVLTPGTSTGGAPRPAAPIGVPPGSITAVHLAPGAVGSAQLAPNAVTGAQVLDHSITSADLVDGPRAAYADGDQIMLIAGAVVVRSVTMTAPAAGRVVLNGSGVIAFGSFTGTSTARCSITTGTSIDADHLIVASVPTVTSILQAVPVAGTRAFDVAAGTTQFNFVCDAPSGFNVLMFDSSLTAVFVSAGS